MRANILFFMLLFPFLWLRSEENLALISQQAEALREAEDDAGASSLYESLLSRPLPRWQQARIWYNLGTLRLSQQRTSEAFEFFQKITPNDLSLPEYGRELFLNRGIGYMQYAHQFSVASPLAFFRGASHFY